MVPPRQAELAPPAEGAAAAGAVEARPLGRGVARQHGRDQRVELGDGQAGHGAEDRGIATQPVVAQDHRGPPPPQHTRSHLIVTLV